MKQAFSTIRILYLLPVLFVSAASFGQSTELKAIINKNNEASLLVYSAPQKAYNLCIDIEHLELNLMKKGPINRKLLRETASTENMLGIISLNKMQLAKANKYYFKALRIYDLLENKQGVATMHNNIGCVFFQMEDYYKALDYFQKSLNLRDISNDSTRLANSYGNIGSVYSNLYKTEKALQYFLKELEIRELCYDSAGLAKTYNNIGVEYAEQENIDLGIYYLNRAIDFKKRLGMHNTLAYSIKELGRIFLKQKNLKKADSLLNLALVNAVQYENHEGQLEIYDLLIDLSRAEKDENDELFYLKKSQEVSKRLAELKKEALAAQFEFKYLSEKKESEIKELQINNDFKSYKLASKNRWINTLWLGLSLLLLFLILLYIQFRNQVNANKHLVKKNLAIVESEQTLLDLKQQLLKESEKTGKKKDKYQASPLQVSQRDLLKKEILRLMEVEKIYCEKTFSLDSFSNALNVNRTYISQIINDEFGKNFNAFVNEYRIKEIKRILASDKANILTIEAIASEVGFNSKSTFNSAFKKYTGITPSFYLRQIKTMKR